MKKVIFATLAVFALALSFSFANIHVQQHASVVDPFPQTVGTTQN